MATVFDEINKKAKKAADTGAKKAGKTPSKKANKKGEIERRKKVKESLKNSDTLRAAKKGPSKKSKSGITGGAAAGAKTYAKKNNTSKKKQTKAQKAKSYANSIKDQKLTSNEMLLLQTLSRTGTPDVVNKGLRSASKTLTTKKSKNGEYKNLNTRVAKQDEKFLNSSPFMYGVMDGSSLVPLKKAVEASTGKKIDTSRAEDTAAYKAGYMVGQTAQYAGTGGVAHGAVKAGVAKALTKGGTKVASKAVKAASSIGADVLTGLPTNTIEAGKEASRSEKDKSKTFGKSLALNTGFDVGLGTIGELPSIVKATKANRSSYIPKETVPKESKKVYREYVKSNDEGVKKFAEKAEAGKVSKKASYKLSDVDEDEVLKIKNLTGIDTTGFTHSLRANTITEHIQKRHGESGKADKSMADLNDLSRINYIIKNADDIELLKNSNGSLSLSNEVFNSDGSRAKKIIYTKKVDGHYYVVEAVPDSGKKRIQVVTAYINKAGNKKTAIDQLADADFPTPSSHAQDAVGLADNNISHAKIDVKGTEQKNIAYNIAREQVPDSAEIPADKVKNPDLIAKAESRKIEQKTAEIENAVKESEILQKSALEKDLGADTNKIEADTDENIQKYGEFKKNGRYTGVPKATAYGDTTQAAVNIRNSKEFAEAREAIDKGINEGDFTKHTESQEEALSMADQTIKDRGLDTAAGMVAGHAENPTKVKAEVSQQQIMLGYKVAQKYLDEGNIDKAVEVLADTATLESEAGRALQAARIFSSLTPMGKIKAVKRAAAKLSAEKGVNIKLNKELLEKLAQATDADEAARIQNDIAVDMWNQVPPTIMEKINAWRYTSMLSSPKTHIRNVFGNALFVPFRIISNGLQVGMEKAFVKKANRTRTILNPATDRELIKRGSEDYKKIEFTLRNNTKYIDTQRPQGSRVYKLPPLEGARKFVSWSLDAEDGLFMKYHYSRAYARYLKAQKVSGEIPEEVAKKARAFARQDALEATYRDANGLTDFLNNTRKTWANSDSKIMSKIGTMFLDTTVPFAKTPVNILKQGVRYSPLNLAKGLVEAGFYGGKKAIRTPEQLHKAIRDISEGLTGTGITALGAYLAYEGVLNSGMDSQSKKGKYDSMLGEQEYSVNIGDYTFTVDWAIPASLPLFMGAEVATLSQERGLSFIDTLNAISNIAEPLLNLSMLSGIENTFNIAFGQGSALKNIAKNTAENYVSQFFPSLLAQIAKSTTKNRKSTTATDQSAAERQLKRFLNQLTNKIPVANDEYLADYVDLWGRKEVKKTNEDYFRALLLNVFSPGTLKEKNQTKVDKELQDLYGKLDNDTANSILPNNVPSGYTFTFEGTNYQMSEKDLEKYKVARGRKAYNKLEKLITTSKYSNMSNEEKAKAIKEIYDESSTYAKEKFLKSKGISEEEIAYNNLSKQKKEQYESMSDNITKEAYLAALSPEAKRKADTDNSSHGRGMPTQEEAAAYLDSLGYSREVKAELWQAYNKSWKASNNPYR